MVEGALGQWELLSWFHQLAERVAVLDGGRVVADGTSDHFKQRVAGQRLDLVLAGHVVASMVHNAVSTVLVCGVAFLIGFLPDADPLESEEGRAWI